MPQYYTLPTAIGEAKIANAIALGGTITISELAVGDGGGSLPVPDSDRTTLVNEVRRAPINTSVVDPDNPSWIVVEQVLPPDIGGWTIREIGLFDSDGDLIAYGNYPETYKPVLSEGSGRTQTIRFVMQVSDTAAVTLKVDPSVVLATREYVDDSITAHAASRDHPPATTAEQGMIRLATSEETRQGTRTDRATHPAGVKSAIENVMVKPGTKNVGSIDANGVLELTQQDGRYITLQGHGAANYEITGFGNQCSVGWEVSLYIPRTIGDSGGVIDALGNYVQFVHTATGDGLDLTINKRMDNGAPLYTYQAYPDANDHVGDASALHEQLTFIHEGAGRWRLVAMPLGAFGENAGGRWEKDAIGSLRVSKTITVDLTNPDLLAHAHLLPVMMMGNTHYGGWSAASSISSADKDSLSRVIFDSSESNADTFRLVVHSPNAGADINERAMMHLAGRWKPNV